MNNEIKEILDWLKDEDIYVEDYGYQYKRISLKEIKQLLDYITNLRQENERLKEANKILEENWKEYMARCGKAIEILYNLNDTLPLDLILSEIEHCKYILQNGSDEE